jgi:DNA-binding GntR family transcriptional regulator
MTVADMKRRKKIAALSSRPAARGSDRGRDIERSIYEEMHRAISDRRLPPGTKLVEEHLADAFGVSRARSRSVLQSLARDKVVTLEPNRGAFVSHPSPDEARQVFAARKVLEVGLAEAVVAGVTDKALEKLRKHVAIEEQTEHGPDRHRDLKNSHDFHMLLAQFADNPVLEAFLGELLARSALITAIYERSDGSLCSHVSHRHLIDILEKRDRQAYAEAMLVHLHEVEANLDLTEPEDTGNVDLRRLFRPRRPARAS